MTDLSQIQGIEAAAREQLRQAGILTIQQLASSDAEQLADRFERVASSSDEELLANLRGWISKAQNLIETKHQRLGEEPLSPQASAYEPGVPDQELRRFNYEKDPKNLKRSAATPEAIRMTGQSIEEAGIEEAGIEVAQSPEDKMLCDEEGGNHIQEAKRSNPSPTRKKPDQTWTVSNATFSEKEKPRFDPATLRTGGNDTLAKHPFDVNGKDRQRVGPAIGKTDDDDPEMQRKQLICTPLASTNRGKHPESRRFIRGVLHHHPWKIRFGAVVTLLLLILLPIALLSGFLLFALGEAPVSFSWVPPWLIYFPLLLPVAALAYAIWGYPGKCLICRQRLFAKKAAFKHIKAHRLFGMGYIIPLCIHALIFHWFRCSSCGTPVRLKK